MYALRLSRTFDVDLARPRGDTMHPLLATMIATAEVKDRHSAADARRRGRTGKPQARRLTLRRPHRAPRVAPA
jgi:hypothetical protein